MTTEQKMEIPPDPVNTSQPMTSKGGHKTMPFIIANEAFEKVASYGLQANMILYLVTEYHLDNANGATILFLWGAISNFMPIFGAFLSDSYLGRFLVIALGTLLTLLGIVVLWITAIVPDARPPHCNVVAGNCFKPKPEQLALLLSSFVLMSIGSGGVRPCSLAFGADQFNNPNNPKKEIILQTFFNWYYASVGISVMISVTVIVYIQTEAGWIVGFGVPVGLMVLSTALFLAGSSLYVKVKGKKSLITDFAQVIAASWKKRHLALPPKDSQGWYHHNNDIKFVLPTEKLRYLNKACIIRSADKDLKPDGSALNLWNLCTVQQVEELKTLIRVLPIWSTGIIIAVTISQHSFPVLQAKTMDTHLTRNFKIPPGSFGIFGILTLTIWVSIYDRVIVPWISKFTKRERGLSLKQRMGTGLVLSSLAMAVAALVERKRRDRAIEEGLGNDPLTMVKISAMWLVPQHCLSGLAEAFNAIGQIEFYYSQFPKTMSSIAVALFFLSLAVGNVVGSLIVKIIDQLSKKGSRESWVSNNLNRGRYDYYYWIISALCAVNFIYFIFCSWAYEEQKVWDEVVELKEKESSKDPSIVEIAHSKNSPLTYST